MIKTPDRDADPIRSPVSLPAASSVWGERAGPGMLYEQRSALDGSVLHRVSLLDSRELDRLLSRPAGAAMDRTELLRFAVHLAGELAALSPQLAAAMQHETGFIRRDCDELLDGTLAYLGGFGAWLAANERPDLAPLPYRVSDGERHIRLHRTSWGTIAVILPQNAFLLVAVTAMLNALAAGNRVILRPPQQSACSAALFIVALERAAASSAISVIFARSRDFMAALYHSAQALLIHYMGSSQHAAPILADGFQGGKPVIADGSGNCWVWVDANADIAHTVDLLTAGATRYNGQTCTSINGAIIHPAIWSVLRAGLVERWQQLRAGNPASEEVEVGPLFDVSQAAWCQQQILQSGGTVLVGGGLVANLLNPTLVSDPDPGSELVTQGIFGPGLWIASGDRSTFVERWLRNRYPLCAGVLSARPDVDWWQEQLAGLARLSVNGDPSVEHIFEPWGGYPAAASNPVGIWLEKYQRVVAIDEPVQ